MQIRRTCGQVKSVVQQNDLFNEINVDVPDSLIEELIVLLIPRKVGRCSYCKIHGTAVYTSPLYSRV